MKVLHLNRLATSPGVQHRVAALFMVKRFVALRPAVFAKVKLDNEASKRLFESAGFKPKYIIYEPENES